VKRSVVIFLAALAGAWLAGSYQASHNGHTPASKPCVIHNGPALPSGDAAHFTDGTTRVCTDGTWVKVTRYGN
jgi:hypothetical protein